MAPSEHTQENWHFLWWTTKDCQLCVCVMLWLSCQHCVHVHRGWLLVLSTADCNCFGCEWCQLKDCLFWCLTWYVYIFNEWIQLCPRGICLNDYVRILLLYYFIYLQRLYLHLDVRDWPFDILGGKGRGGGAWDFIEENTLSLKKEIMLLTFEKKHYLPQNWHCCKVFFGKNISGSSFSKKCISGFEDEAEKIS